MRPLAHLIPCPLVRVAHPPTCCTNGPPTFMKPNQNVVHPFPWSWNVCRNCNEAKKFSSDACDSSQNALIHHCRVVAFWLSFNSLPAMKTQPDLLNCVTTKKNPSSLPLKMLCLVMGAEEGCSHKSCPRHINLEVAPETALSVLQRILVGARKSLFLKIQPKTPKD